jgi:hypothetical protein
VREQVIETYVPPQDSPPPPDPFPPGWGSGDGVVVSTEPLEAAGSKAEVHEEQPPSPVDEDLPSPEGEDPEPNSTTLLSTPAVTPAMAEEVNAPEPVPAEVPESVLPHIVLPVPPVDGENVQMITVVLRSMGDKVRDNLRIRQIFGTLISYPGNDRFAFHIFENGHGHLLEFPNLTTGVCPELVSRLYSMVGKENVRIETITFQ